MDAREITDRLISGSITVGWIHCNGVEFWIKIHPFPRDTVLYPIYRIQDLIERNLGFGYDDEVRGSVLRLIEIGER